MALVFAVFLLTLLVVFLRPEGRARRVAQLKDVAARAANVTRTVLHAGTETVEKIAADLAEDNRGTGGVSPLLSPADAASADHHAEPSASS
jgi:precorrin-4 methylase